MLIWAAVPSALGARLCQRVRAAGARGQMVQQRVLEGAPHHHEVLAGVRHLLGRQPILCRHSRIMRSVRAG